MSRIYTQQELKEHLGAELEISDLVEDRINETYQQVRVAGSRERKKNIWGRRSCVAAAAAICVVLAGTSVGVMAANGFFTKEVVQTKDSVNYQFDINYELVPGQYEVAVDQLPEGYVEQDDQKYHLEGSDSSGISVLPIYNTADLDAIGNQLSQTQVNTVEHATLSGMEADIITLQDDQKYQRGKYIFLFNPMEGYVIEVWGDYGTTIENLKTLADHLTVTRVGDAAYETAQQASERQQEQDADAANAEAKAQAVEAGIPENKLMSVGEEAVTVGGEMGYTINEYEYLDSVKGLDEADFYNYEELSAWLNEDGTMKPHTREHLDAEGALVDETQVNTKFLKVNVTAHCYEESAACEYGQWLSARLIDVTNNADGTLTWSQESYGGLPSENYITEPEYPIYMTDAVNTEGELRRDFFFRPMQAGDEVTYTLIFAVDEDRIEDQILQFAPDTAVLDNGTTLDEIMTKLPDYSLLEK